MYFAEVDGRAVITEQHIELLLARMEKMRLCHPYLTFDVTRYDKGVQAAYLFKLYPDERLQVLTVDPWIEQGIVWARVFRFGQWLVTGHIYAENLEQYYPGFTLVDTAYDSDIYVKLLASAQQKEEHYG